MAQDKQRGSASIQGHLSHRIEARTWAMPSWSFRLLQEAIKTPSR